MDRILSTKFSNSKYSAIQTDQELRPKWSQRSNLDNNDIRPQYDERQGPYEDPNRDGGDQIASWKTGFWTNLPVLAIASLIGVFACTALAVGVLASSNGRAVQTWRFFTPSVCLAVLSVVSNALLAVALAEGLVISFWRKALHSCTGFGFKVDCELESNSIIQNVTLASWHNLFNTSVTLYPIPLNPYNDNTFFAGLQLDATFYEGFKVENSLSGQHMPYLLTSYICKLQGGIVANLTAPATRGWNSVIGGFQYAGDYLFSSQATFEYKGAISATRLAGSLVNQMVANTSDSWFITFHDPMDTMLDAMREIAFRAALQAGKNNVTVTNAQQSVPFTGHDTHTIYTMDTKYMVLGALVSLMGVVSVGATFYGWWQLGRKVSMSPLEIAKAFDAPLLREMGSNVSNERIPIYIKSQRVQYGVGTVRKRGDTTFKKVQEIEHLILGPVDSVRSPVAGVAYT
ncbi:hypothetical protein EPUS_03356 [Endocarpon pusillum Z07020]|uniref:Uncharacterized protein n=1 Tax=Endocarpon pusillum (strain Z07020 / HMAS-L-300199) TaxID=1263415 RepID=U1GQD9_ENDPU|nr:uncharacterized protein EPUS_03356 [Endocarpon pusillum Z07020]ERF74166.1 hypothetical protein EPUS_03356 [Endocarpon pusillum Z07020]